MTSNAIPIDLYESLLLKLVSVLELTLKPEGTLTPQAKQNLLAAVSGANVIILLGLTIPNTWFKYPQTNDFKAAMRQAKDLAMSLPGGELLISEQDEIIAMLETLKDRKKFVIQVYSYAIAN